jgi:hypothetical protein
MRDPADLSPEERFRELAELFARGILRSRGKNVPSRAAEFPHDALVDETSEERALLRSSLGPKSRPRNPSARLMFRGNRASIVSRLEAAEEVAE